MKPGKGNGTHYTDGFGFPDTSCTWLEGDHNDLARKRTSDVILKLVTLILTWPSPLYTMVLIKGVTERFTSRES
jgi:hypothetical protein